jgi:hypothetical protein
VVNWSAKNIRLEVLPELDRGEFYRRKRKAGKRAGAEDSVPALETVIGYPELADRIAIIQDDLEPAAVESLKYYLLLKAEESLSGEKEISVWYHGKNKDALEFHLYGIREEEVAVTRVPFSIYERTLEDYKKHPKGEIFTFLRSGSYLSIQNMLRPDALK